jgi:hypothetical protein
MTANTTADQFAHLLRTVDPASLGTEDKLALISLLQRCLGTDESRIADGDGGRPGALLHRFSIPISAIGNFAVAWCGASGRRTPSQGNKGGSPTPLCPDSGVTNRC